MVVDEITEKWEAVNKQAYWDLSVFQGNIYGGMFDGDHTIQKIPERVFGWGCDSGT